MPKSSKVIVFDLDTSIKEAFNVVEETGIEYSLLWDGEKKLYVGMLTVSDFLDVLIHFNEELDVIKELIEKHNIRKWRGNFNYKEKAIGHRKRPNAIISSSPEDSLYYVLKVIQKNNIRRVPIMDKENLIHVSTYHSIFSYLVKNVKN
jgi:5'-AMP-activated protein kinase regulatory gamma subunit